MKNLKIIFIMLIIATFSCSKDSDSEPKNPEVDVYIADSKGNVFKNGIKNNNFPEETNDAVLVMANSGNDFYLGGVTKVVNEKRKPTYWKNDLKIVINYDTTADGTIYAMATLGNDVYFVANYYYSSTKQRAYLFKNSDFLIEIVGEYSKAFVNEIKIANNKIYLVGNDSNSSTSSSKLWTVDIANTTGFNYKNYNGVGIDLSAIDVVGNDIYIAGIGDEMIKYWKNDTDVNLANDNSLSGVNAIKIIDNNLYIAGYQENIDEFKVAKYWKNGTEVALSNESNKSFRCEDIAVNGSDVYAVGSCIELNNFKPKFWKNQEEILIQTPNTESYFHTIILKPKN